MVRAICFDFDGTLVDSEHLHYAAWQAELQPFGCSLEKSRYMAQFSGVSTYATAKTLIQDYQLPIATEQLMAQKTARFLSLLETELPTPMPGAYELLRDMQQSELAVALVTGSYRKEIEPVLDSLGWRDFFPLIITRDDVQNAKPHPEPYLTALERLNFSAGECLALEDSATLHTARRRDRSGPTQPAHFTLQLTDPVARGGSENVDFPCDDQCYR